MDFGESIQMIKVNRRSSYVTEILLSESGWRSNYIPADIGRYQFLVGRQ